MNDRTVDAVRRQISAMRTDVFEIGLYKPAVDSMTKYPEMLPRTWDVEHLMKSIAWLKFQNREGRNIYIRPKGEHALSLVDDLTSAALQRMKDSGFAPAVIVETSPNNFQAWVNHGRVLPKDVSSAASRALAERFGGDLGSADWRHYGRLAGFTNRKERHQLPDGRFPFVRLVSDGAAVYPAAEEFLSGIEAKLDASRKEAEQRRARAYPRSSRYTSVKSIDDFRRDPRYGGDGNRIDLAYAVYALSHGIPEDQVRGSLTSRDLRHKGNEARQTGYIERTIAKAMIAVRETDRGR